MLLEVSNGKHEKEVQCQFKREAVGQVKKPGNFLGLVAKELELGEGVLRRWVKQFSSGRWESEPRKDLKSIQAQEL